MAAPTLAQIRSGLETNLTTIPDTQVSAYRLANPTPPCVMVLGPDEVAYHKAMGNGHDTWTIVVMAFAGLVSDIGAQKVLDKFIAATGSTSVKAAIESDTTLGGAVNDLIVVSCSGYREYTVGQKHLLGAEWTVVVEADGK